MKRLKIRFHFCLGATVNFLHIVTRCGVMPRLRWQNRILRGWTIEAHLNELTVENYLKLNAVRRCYL